MPMVGKKKFAYTKKKKSLNKIRKKNKALEGIQFSKTRWINI